MLIQAGQEASTAHDQGLGGAVDENIAKACQVEARILVTLDLDFADIRAYPPEEYPGIIVMRLKQHDKSYVLTITSRWIKALADEMIENRLWIVDDQKIRIWK